MNKRARIIELNDKLRTTFKGGRVQMTPAVYNLDPQLRGHDAKTWPALHKVTSLIFCAIIKLLQAYNEFMSIENGKGSSYPSNPEGEHERVKFDRKTGREVVTSYQGLKWKDGYVLRALTTEETLAPATRDIDVQMLGGDPFEWVPASAVDIAEE